MKTCTIIILACLFALALGFGNKAYSWDCKDLGLGSPIPNYIDPEVCLNRHFTGPDKHEGVDYIADVGTDVLAIADGEVQYVMPEDNGNDGWGYFVIIKHSKKVGGSTVVFHSLYAHLEKVSWELLKATWEFAKQSGVKLMVSRGERIAQVGTTGNAQGTTCPHLHLEVIVNCSHDPYGPTECDQDKIDSEPCIRPEIVLTPTLLEFEAVQNETPPASQYLSITNDQAGTLNWEVSDDADWLVVSPISGERNSAMVEVTVNTTNKEPGDYEAFITVSSTNAINSPQYVTVTYTVNPKISFVIDQLFPRQGDGLTGGGNLTVRAYVEPVEETMPAGTVVEFFLGSEYLGEAPVSYSPPRQQWDSITGEIVTIPAQSYAYWFGDCGTVPNLWEGTIDLSAKLKIGGTVVSEKTSSLHVGYWWRFALCGMWRVTYSEEWESNHGTSGLNCNCEYRDRLFIVGNGTLQGRITWFHHPENESEFGDPYCPWWCHGEFRPSDFQESWQESGVSTACGWNNENSGSTQNNDLWDLQIGGLDGDTALFKIWRGGYPPQLKLGGILVWLPGTFTFEDRRQPDAQITSTLEIIRHGRNDYPRFTYQRTYEYDDYWSDNAGCYYHDSLSSVQYVTLERLPDEALPIGKLSVGNDTSENNDNLSNVQAHPTSYVLSQNYPNPFNPETEISFSLPERTQVSLIIYNVLGKKVRTLVNETRDAGTHNVRWDGRDEAGNALASGIYFCRLKTENFEKTMKMVMMK